MQEAVSIPAAATQKSMLLSKHAFYLPISFAHFGEDMCAASADARVLRIGIHIR